MFKKLNLYQGFLVIVAIALALILYFVWDASGFAGPQHQGPIRSRADNLSKPVGEWSWFSPPDEVLLNAARNGFAGAAVEPYRPYDQLAATCRGDVSAVYVLPARIMAHYEGAQARKDFNPLPQDKRLLNRTKNTAMLWIFYGSPISSGDLSAALKQGEKVYKPAKTEHRHASTISCGSGFSRRVMWNHTATLVFQGEGGAPPSGVAVLIVRRAGRIDEEFELRLDQLN